MDIITHALRIHCWAAVCCTVLAVGCGVIMADTQPARGKPPTLDELKHIALQPGTGSAGEKLHAVYAIRDIGGKPAVEALLDLLGKVKPKRVPEAVIACLGQLGGNEVKERLAALATDVALGERSLNQLGRMVSIRDEVVLRRVLTAVQDNAGTLPAANLAAAIRLFETTAYRPSASFIRQMASRKDARVQVAAVRALGQVGDPKDTGTLWRLVHESPDRRLRAKAVRSIGQLGAEDDAKKLLTMAEALQATINRESPQFLIMRDVAAARAAILARITSVKAGALTVTSATSVAGGVKIAVVLPDNCHGLLVAVSEGKRHVAHGFVEGEVVNITLPAGTFSASLRPLMPCDAQWLQRSLVVVSHLHLPEFLLKAGKPVVVEKLQAKELAADAAAVTNAVVPRSLDDYARTLKEGDFPKTASRPIVLKGTLVSWPSKRNSELFRLGAAVPTFPLTRRGLKLYGDKGYVYLESIERTLSTRESGKEAFVVGQLCRAWDGASYIFLVLDAWVAKVRHGGQE